MGTQEQHPNPNPNPDPTGKAIGGQEQQYLVTAAQAQITRDSALGIGHGEEAEEEGQQEHKAGEKRSPAEGGGHSAEERAAQNSIASPPLARRIAPSTEQEQKAEEERSPAERGGQPQPTYHRGAP